MLTHAGYFRWHSQADKPSGFSHPSTVTGTMIHSGCACPAKSRASSAVIFRIHASTRPYRLNQSVSGASSPSMVVCHFRGQTSLTVLSVRLPVIEFEEFSRGRPGRLGVDHAVAVGAEQD